MISVARSGVLVKSYPGRFSFLGSTLYNEKNFPETRTPVGFKNPVLAAFANAVYRCSTAADVATTLNEAVINADKAGIISPGR